MSISELDKNGPIKWSQFGPKVLFWHINVIYFSFVHFQHVVYEVWFSRVVSSFATSLLCGLILSSGYLQTYVYMHLGVWGFAMPNWPKSE